MNYESLLKILISNPKLTRNAILHYFSLLYLAINNPYPSSAYLATKTTSKELEEKGLLVGNISPLNDLLTKEGLIKRLEGQSRSVYILGEKHKIQTMAGEMVTNVWYFERANGEEIVHQIKEVKSRAKTYNTEFKEVLDFYWDLFKKKYGVTPVVDIPKTRKQLKNILKQTKFQVFKACIPIFMDLEDDYLDNHKYPIHLIGYRMNLCKEKLNDKIIYYGMVGREDEFCKKYIAKVIKDKKLTVHQAFLDKRDGGIIAKQNNRQPNPKP
jgi:hypothetical protein